MPLGTQAAGAGQARRRQRDAQPEGGPHRRPDRRPAARRTSSTPPYEFDALREAGAHIGSGSVVIADDRACVVDLARLLTKFSADEACGKTIPCRIGLRRLYEIGDRVATGTPKPTDMALMADLAHDVAASGLCEHERLATLPFTSGMRYFRSELDDHLLRSSCPAGVCHPIAVGAAATPGPR